MKTSQVPARSVRASMGAAHKFGPLLPILERTILCPVRVSEEGYVLHSYGNDAYLRYAVASVVTLRRHDTVRPVALYCSPEHQRALDKHGLRELFDVVANLDTEHRSIVGFKHRLHLFMPFKRCLFVDSDIIWCRSPNPLWMQLRPFGFTATGLECADIYFGASKNLGVVADVIFDRRRRTLRAFGLTYLPRIQAGMIYACDRDLTGMICEAASGYLARQSETHFRTRLNQGRSEESCEWSLAMAMSQMRLPVFPWYQGPNSPQLDYIPGMTDHTPDFDRPSCRYYNDRFIYSLRGLKNARMRDTLIGLASLVLRRRDWLHVTPFALHFSWLHAKAPFRAFAARTWEALLNKEISPEALNAKGM